MSKILAIETSCDETAAAVLRFQKNKTSPLCNVIATQINIHRKTGGVVPEVAARAHVKKIVPVVSKALHQAKSKISEIEFIAVTAGPGLITSLMIGLEFAKSLAFASGKKIIPVNHMAGHMYSPFIGRHKIKFPNITLIVSGGHTYLALLKDFKNYKVIGQTLDDAAGEAFDKIAKMIGLSYPGGPAISKTALSGKKDYGLPRPMMHSKDFNFSFAGLKTAVLYKIRDEKLNTNISQVRADISLSFQNAVVEVLTAKTIAAAQKYAAKSIALAGGVAANKQLRQALNQRAESIKAEFYVPDFSLCTDNAAMIGNAAAIMLRNGFKPRDYKSLRADPNWQL